MLRCAKCGRKCRTLSYAGGLCSKCSRKAVRSANQEFARAVVQEEQRLEDRRRELAALRWPARVARGIIWGTYDGLRCAVQLFVGLSRIISPNRGYQPDVGAPNWPGWPWFIVWSAFTLTAVIFGYFVWGNLAALIAFLGTAPILGAIRGGLRAARNDWTWWLGQSSGGT